MLTIDILLVVFIILITIKPSLASDEFRTYTFSELFIEEADIICKQTISMYEDWIFAGQFIYSPYSVGKTYCNNYTLEIYADYPENLDSLRIMFHVENNGSGNNGSEINGRGNSGSGNNGNGERTRLSNLSFTLNVFDGNKMMESLEMCKNCSQTYGTFVTSDEVLKIIFPSKMMSSWSLGFTSFHSGLCHSYEYMCANKRCIFHSLSCNGFDPCGDQSDCYISPAAYATIALGGFCALGVLFLIIYMFIKSRKTFDWSSRGRQPRKFSPAKALQNVQSFTPATVSITPIQRRWSYKY